MPLKHADYLELKAVKTQRIQETFLLLFNYPKEQRRGPGPEKKLLSRDNLLE